MSFTFATSFVKKLAITSEKLTLLLPLCKISFKKMLFDYQQGVFSNQCNHELMLQLGRKYGNFLY